MAALHQQFDIVLSPVLAQPPAPLGWHHTHLPGLARRLQLDILHSPSYRRLLWQKPCAIVGTIHDLAPFHVRGKYDWKRMLYGKVIVKHLARRQDALVAVSENTARDIQHFFGIPRNRIDVVWNGLDHERFHPGDIDDARRGVSARWNLDQPFFLYVSRIEHPAKNHVRLINAFNEFKAATRSNWILALGGSDWHGAESVHQAAAASPYRTDIRFLGFVEDAALPDLYRAAGVFIYPSLFEGFGFPPVEAMACGVPVISSIRGSLREVVGNAALVIEPEDVAGMARAMTGLSTDPQRGRHLVEKGLVHARRFDWNQNAEQTLAIYRRILDVRAR
jgi:glycosyltransferase involved in cell wall biosynthesis